jgi:hypothetical protein
MSSVGTGQNYRGGIIVSDENRKKVYKVVRVDSDGRLVSTMLPDHLRTIYRDNAGRIKRAKSSMAFRRVGQANGWANVWVSYYQGWNLEVWEAEAEVVRGVTRILGDVVTGNPKETYYQGHQINHLDDRLMPKDVWEDLVSSVEADGRLNDPTIFWTRGSGRITMLRANGHKIVVNTKVPKGAILCRDLRLVRPLYVTEQGILNRYLARVDDQK